MHVIHKFGPLVPNQQYDFENIHKIVHFGAQDEMLFIWAEVDLAPECGNRQELLIVGTGHAYEPYYNHIQSVVTNTGMVWHLLKI